MFCPRYRRKIFNICQVESRFKEIVKEVCIELGIEIIAMECDQDHVHLFVHVLPNLSPSDIMQKIKGVSSKKLRDEFTQLSKMSSLWTRSYFVSTTGSVSTDTVKDYVESQNTRY